MILELDCGNTLIKWRVISSDSGDVVFVGVAANVAELLVELQCLSALSLQRCRLVSVRGEEETTQLIAAIEHAFGLMCCLAKPALCVAGVRNGYADYERLGMDRWLAIIGAYQLARGACLVLDLGTAITADYVNAAGEHLGGYICPGLPLMRGLLRTHTQRIRYEDPVAGCNGQTLRPGRTTMDAVERGSLLMLRGFAETQLGVAAECLGADFEVFLTGGDSSLIGDVVPFARVVPDLVFIGLAVVCP